MTTVGELQIKMFADMAMLRSNMNEAKTTVSGTMDDIKERIVGAFNALKGKNSTTEALSDLSKGSDEASSALEQLIKTQQQVADSMNRSAVALEANEGGWRKTIQAVGSFVSGLKAGVDIFDRFGGNTPKWLTSLDAAKVKFTELTAGIRSSNLAAKETEAAAASISTLEGATAKAANGFRAAIPAVGGFMAALGPLLIIAALITAAYLAVKLAISAAGDAISGTVPGMGLATSALQPFVTQVQDAANATKKLSEDFGYTNASSTVLIATAARLGVTANDMAGGLQKLSDAAQADTDKFKEFGISVTDASGKLKPASELATETFQALDKLALSSERSAAATYLFSGSLTELTAASKGSDAQQERSIEILSQYSLILGGDAVAAVKRYEEAERAFKYNSELTWQSFKTTIGTAVIPMLTDFFETFTGGWPKVSKAFNDGVIYISERAYAFRDTLMGVIDSISGGWDKLIARFSAAGDIFKAARSLNTAGVTAAYEELQTKLAVIDKQNFRAKEAREIESYTRIQALKTIGQGGGTIGGGSTDKSRAGRWKEADDIENEAKAVNDLEASMLALTKARAAYALERVKSEFKIEEIAIQATIDSLNSLRTAGNDSMAAIAQVAELMNAKVEVMRKSIIAEEAAISDALSDIVELIKKAEKSNNDKAKIAGLAAYVEENKKLLAVMVRRAELDVQATKNAEIQAAAIQKLWAEENKRNEVLQQAATRAIEENEAMKLSNEEIGLTARELNKLNVTRLEAKIILQQVVLGTEMATEADEVYLQGLIKQSKALQDRDKILANKTAIEEYKTAMKSLSDTAVSFFEDLFQNGSKAFSNLWTQVKKFFAQLAAQLAVKYILGIDVQGGALGTVSALLGGGGGGAGGSGIIGSVVSSLLGSGGIISTVGSSVVSWLGGAFGAGVGTFASSVSALTAAGTPFISAVTQAASAALGMSTASLAAAAGWAAFAVAAVMAGDKLYSNGWRSENGPATSLANYKTQKWNDLGRFGAPGLAKENLLIKLGLNEKWASILSGTGLLSRMFGYAKPEVTGGGITGTVSASGLTGQQYTDWKQKGGWFRSDKHGTDNSAIDPAFLDSLNGAISGMMASFKKLGLEIGVGAHILDDFSGAFKVELFKLSDADMQKAIDAGLRGVADQMAFAFVNKMRDSAIAATSNIASALPDVVALADAYAAKHKGEKDSEGKYAEYIGQLFAAAQALGALVKVVGGPVTLSNIAAMQHSGETLLQTFSRINTVFVVTNDIATMLGKGADAFGAVGLASLDMRQSLIDLAGGIDALNAASTFYFEHFYSESERSTLAVAKAQKQLNEGFAELGISAPKTMAEFRALVEAQDLSTESGQRMYAALIKFGPAFSMLTDDSGLKELIALLPKLAISVATFITLTKQQRDDLVAIAQTMPLFAADLGRLALDEYTASKGGIVDSFITQGEALDKLHDAYNRGEASIVDLASATRAFGAAAIKTLADLYRAKDLIDKSATDATRSLNLTGYANDPLSTQLMQDNAGLLLQLKEAKEHDDKDEIDRLNLKLSNNVAELDRLRKQRDVDFLRDEAERARAAIKAENDPTKINDYVNRIIANTMQTFAMLSPEEQAARRPEFLASIATIRSEGDARLTDLQSVIRANADAQLKQQKDVFDSAIESFNAISRAATAAADTQVIAANTQLDAAQIAANTRVEVDVKIDIDQNGFATVRSN